MHHPVTCDVSVTCSDLTFRWPDGTTLFDGLSMSVARGRTGLVGANGSGKSTLLRLIAGLSHPAQGSVTVHGRLAYLPQDITLETEARVDQALGIADERAALHAIESGDASETNFDIIGDDWDVEERALATLGTLGLDTIGLDRSVGELSGGQAVLLRLAALLMERPDVLLLDEPTNNLDLFARRRLYEAVESWRWGALIVVSHDLELLERVDRTAELRKGEVTWYGGGWSAYQEALGVQQEAARRTLRAAESDLRKQKKEMEATRIRLARRQRQSKKLDAQGGIPKIVANAHKKAAQVSAGKLKGLHQDRLQEAQERKEEAADAVRQDTQIRVELPHTVVPGGRDVARLSGLRLYHGRLTDADLLVRGPERIALVGRNGAGKTSLLRTLVGDLEPLEGEAKALVPLRFLPQRLDLLDEARSVVDNVARAAPQVSAQHVRAQLAKFLFRGSRADRPAGTLSGGERFRASLAMTMLATPAPQLLVLDEPTNNLDVSSVRQLVGALSSYEGALMVASHDLPFLEAIGITRWLFLDERLRETTAERVRELLEGEETGQD
ncbi:ABC-F family ATP-binding cassette domain-containing protein [Nocardiopsis alkaliphila]|uniref:ABC-F family ATP-binding cassette domain-containing protein n=1 Tax=Nocardiopsis alkaliphila TaxID=225762 RepID=UPI00034AE0DE|nr:ABC-F family ATP-binding cassette domain-containing protein [Nocardiopsis alkaliphila]